jgi:hypothetical protein
MSSLRRAQDLVSSATDDICSGNVGNAQASLDVVLALCNRMMPPDADLAALSAAQQQVRAILPTAVALAVVARALATQERLLASGKEVPVAAMAMYLCRLSPMPRRVALRLLALAVEAQLRINNFYTAKLLLSALSSLDAKAAAVFSAAVSAAADAAAEQGASLADASVPGAQSTPLPCPSCGAAALSVHAGKCTECREPLHVCYRSLSPVTQAPFRTCVRCGATYAGAGDGDTAGACHLCQAPLEVQG